MDSVGHFFLNEEGKSVYLCVMCLKEKCHHFKKPKKHKFLFVSEKGREAAWTHQSLDMKVCQALLCFIFLSE